jgi:hypothetical protein
MANPRVEIDLKNLNQDLPLDISDELDDAELGVLNSIFHKEIKGIISDIADQRVAGYISSIANQKEEKITSKSSHPKFSSKTNAQFAAEEVIHKISPPLCELTAVPTDNGFWTFSCYSIIFPEILSELRFYMLPQTPAIGRVWNYYDALWSFLLSFGLMLDKTNHRSFVTKTKGVLSFLSGTELVLLTALNYSWLGGPGFAIATGISFLMALEDTVHKLRRFKDKEYWLKDSLHELLKLEQLIQEIEKDTAAMLLKPTYSTWAFDRKMERLRKYEEKQAHLQADILVRAKSLIVENALQTNSILQEHYYDKSDDLFIATLQNTYFVDDMAKLDTLKRECDSREHKKKEKIIQKKCEEEYKKSRDDTAVSFVACMGMLLMCFPATQLIGILLITAASGYYLHKNADKIAKGLKSIYRFFSPPTDDLEEEHHQVARVALQVTH